MERLELAMGCNYRIALSSTYLGLPEVKLGIIPGAGGTQRLPRLAGIEKALNMITSGIPIKAKDALGSNIIDQIFEDDLIQNAVYFLKGKLDLNHPVVSKLTEKFLILIMKFLKTFPEIQEKKVQRKKVSFTRYRSRESYNKFKL